MRGTQISTLTPRERDMLILVARGLTNQEIAEQLRTPTNKVKIAIHQACVKLEARNRIEAVFFAIKQRNIKVDEIFSLDELVELLASLGPEMVETIAGLLRHQLDSNYFPLTDGQIPHWERKQATILTQREQDTLALVARGLTNQQIADQLYTSTSTVRTFLIPGMHQARSTQQGQGSYLSNKAERHRRQ